MISAQARARLSVRAAKRAGIEPRNEREALISALRRSAEEWVSEDWAAVAKAINERVNELGWRQRELAERSRVSQAIVRELQHHTVERRRSARTLASLSITLGWHPEHLDAVLHGRQPPDVDDQVTDRTDTLWSRLDSLEQRLDEITERLDDLKTDLSTVIENVKPGR
jgi:transcriptional regulator with XRE-family HTH domain